MLCLLVSVLGKYNIVQKTSPDYYYFLKKMKKIVTIGQEKNSQHFESSSSTHESSCLN